MDGDVADSRKPSRPGCHLKSAMIHHIYNVSSTPTRIILISINMYIYIYIHTYIYRYLGPFGLHEIP